VSPGGPYPIDYGAIVPRQGECPNLLVPVCVSASHIAYGSIRMEPVFMILGQSAATAGALAIDSGSAVQAVPYEELRKRLLADGQVLEYSGNRAGVIRIASLEGVVVDDTDLANKDDWVGSQSVSPYIERGYRHDSNARKGELGARFVTDRLESRTYEVRVSYTPHPNRATNVPVTVTHAGGESTLRVNQRLKPGADGVFHSLGTFRFEKGKKATVTIGNVGTDGHVVIDAVQWLPAGGPGE
jgi:hypothetical protein